jgi:TPR repeat protein
MREADPVHSKPAYLRHWPYLAFVAILAVAATIYAAFSGAEEKGLTDAQLFNPRYASFEAKGAAPAELLKKAQEGNVFAQAGLAERYKFGKDGFPQDNTQYFEWARKAAGLGHPWARLESGICYFHGIGTSRDYVKALVMFRIEAVDSNDPVAQLYMGFLSNGNHGLPKNDEVAAMWFRRSADQGNAEAASCYAIHLMNGFGVPKDSVAAIKYLRIAVNSGMTAAMTNLGWSYANGEGVEKDQQQAVRYYRMAAANKDPIAYNNLGLLYLHGQGVIRDDEEAVRFFRLASDNGHIPGKKNLGYMYAEGKGVKSDDAIASRLYLEAAYEGDTECQRVIAGRFKLGVGLPRDPIEAYAWYNIAAASGDEQAINARKELEDVLDGGVASSGQKRSRELLKEIEAKKAKK